jgi:PAS domain S-box-containing protein/diguanylate cyclase (GGDEF)-like protein
MELTSSNIVPIPAGSVSPNLVLPPAVLSMIVEDAGEGVLVADMRAPEQALVYVNAAFEQITGYDRAEALGKNCRYLQGSDRLQPEINLIRRAFEAGEPVTVTLRNYRRDGAMFWNHLRLAPVSDSQGVSHFVGFMRDVTQVLATASRLAEAVHTDRLTGCLSRDAVFEELGSLCARRMTLLAKIDVVRFHEINSGYGHETGNALLIEIARRLQGLGADLVGRVGSDTFAVAFAIERRDEAPARLASVMPRLEERYLLPGANLEVRLAVGFVVCEAGADPLVMVRQAGAALSRCKATLLRRPCEFDARGEQEVRQRLRLTAELQHAVAADEFIYHFQPQVDLATGEVAGAEALLRWRHGLFGLQPPDRFVTLAEQTGLILDIGAQGLPKVADFAVRVNGTRASPMTFSVNVSVVEFTHRDIVSFVEDVMARSGADPTWFTLELTESLMAEDSPQLLEMFDRLRQLGVGLSIDDFGAGYSSLGYIERLPVSEIKLDRSFVTDLDRSAAKQAIAQSVIRIGEALGLGVVAEGVERRAELDILREMGCRLGQGNLFSRPVTPEAFTAIALDGLPPRAHRELR